MLVYGIIAFKSNWRRIAIVCVSIPLAVCCNILRLIAVILTGEAFGQHAGEVVHEWSGYFTYAIAVVCMFVISHFWREQETAPVPLAHQAP
jgi:exosortase/archaeosortase family protein